MAIEEIYILHHTHVDIGYTDLPWLVYEQHVKIIEQALDLCRQTDNFPEPAQFRWINEFSWPVLHFLSECPDRADELLQRHREGRMELCGLYLDPTDLYDQRSFEWSLRPALELAAEHNLPLTTVMTTDIPGQLWSLADIIAKHNFRYLSVSPDPILSKPPQVDRPFYWEGPEGHKVLTWLTDWRYKSYPEGYFLGLDAGIEEAADKISAYLQQLASEGYPWRILALHLARDNWLPRAHLSELVATWNERGDLPPLRIATNEQFLDRLVALHDGEFRTHRAAWPDWWANGNGSAAFETALSRETHTRLDRIAALQAELGSQENLWPIMEDLLFFDEHTWGAPDGSTQQPYSLRMRAGWAHKSLYIYRAAVAADRLETELAAELSVPSKIVVFNPGGEPFCTPIQLAGVDESVDCLRAEDGRAIPVQHIGETAWAVDTVARGRTLYTPGERGEEHGGVSCSGGVLENEFYRIEFDMQTGVVTQIVDLDTGQNIVDTQAQYAFGEVVHERLDGGKKREALWHDAIYNPVGDEVDVEFVRTGSSAHAVITASHGGPVFGRAVSQSHLPHADYVTTELWLWQGLKRLDIQVRINKQPEVDYESLYVAFPLALSSPRAFVENAGAVFEVEHEQLPGTCRDFYSIGDFIGLQGQEGWALLTPLDSPLVQVNDINTARWLEHIDLQRAHVYAWLTNNFWFINFPPYQLGQLRFRFVLTTGGTELPQQQARHFGRAVRVGLVVQSDQHG